MPERNYQYVIGGGGLAGAAAVEGVRERDENGSILLIGSEKHHPYDRPPLSKQLWLGKKKPEEIFLREEAFYAEKHVDLALGVEAVGLDAHQKTILDGQGNSYR